MLGFFTRLWWAITANEDFEKEVIARKREREDKERESRRYNLDLCYKHRQEHNHSHFSEKNCDYCKLLKERDRLEAELLTRRRINGQS